MRLFRSHWLLGLSLLLVLLGIHRLEPVWLQRLQAESFDTYQRIAPRESDSDKMLAQVAILDIDEKSLRELGQWPWPRTLLAEMVNRLTRVGAAAVGFDVVFAEKDRTSPDVIALSRTELSPSLKAELEKLPSNERVFADAIKAGRVVVGQVGLYEQSPTEGGLPKVGFGLLGKNPETQILPSINMYESLVRNLPELEQSAAGIGLFSTRPDVGGIIRRVALVERVGNKLYPSLSLELLRVALHGKDDYLIRGYMDGQPGISSIVVRSANPKIKLEIPTDPHGRVWVHYARYPTAKPPLYISAADLMLANTPEQQQKLLQQLGGKLVLIGTSAAGLKDIRETPINPVMPGVEVHAQLLETILSETHLTRTEDAIIIEWGLILLGGLLLIVLVPRLGAIWTFLLSALLIALLIGTAWHYYTAKHVLIDSAYPALSIFSLFVVLSYLNYMREERERRQVKTAFSHYVSPALLDELAANPDKLALGGETRNITILFSDIRGFTTISEQFSAQELTRFINRFLTPMTNTIMNRKGTIDKYMGDAIMAFWNAPLPVQGHAREACLAALEMQEAVKSLNERLQQEANSPSSTTRYVPISIGVGINTGDCCVGNMGSEQRFDYSALGDDVNLASRLEGQSKTYGVDIVLGQNTVDQLEGALAVIEIDRIKVKGKTEPVTIYALLGDEVARQSENIRHLTETVLAMLHAYRSQDWARARQMAETLGEAHAAMQGLSILYLNRIKEFEHNPPPENWDGVFVATTK